MINVSISFCCLIFLLIISCVYFSKERIKNIDNKIFSFLIIINLIGICLDIGGFFLFKKFSVDSLLNIFISKIYLMYFIVYIFTLTIYVYNLSFNKIGKIIYYLGYIITISAFIMFLLPIQVNMKENVAYSFGPSVNLGYVCVFSLISIMILILVISYKKIISKKYIPILIFIILIFIIFII